MPPSAMQGAGGTFSGGGGVDFGPYLVKPETIGAPIPLGAFFKGSEVKRRNNRNSFVILLMCAWVGLTWHLVSFIGP